MYAQYKEELMAQMSKNGIRYDVRPDYAVVLGFTTQAKNTGMNILNIPSSVWNKPVVRIADYAFKHSCVKEVTLPRCLESIGLYAFEDCKALQKVNYAKTGDFAEKTELQSYCFANCINLQYVASPARWVMDTYVFSNCPNVQVFGLIEKAGLNAFKGCRNLKGLNLLLGGNFAQKPFDGQYPFEVLLCGGPPQKEDYDTLLPILKEAGATIRCFKVSPLLDLSYEGYDIFVIDED